ncbi:centrosome-associated protein ALMS1 isoform X3 [Peromyscus eremicus]|uniref:centrosome-associated protein ALMS1 isoform X3 n=1 Tax=Peromyscus eremicus TaxID=42410 RepID=UPI0027DB82AD|nr:centrosome-associated protein ALMS1 isoform X3 [Peromyscus eremicus]
MEPEDLPWPGELEEEEEEEEEVEEVENASAAATEETEAVHSSEETVRLEEEELEEAGPEVDLDLDFNSEFQPRESTDEEEDEMAKAWLQAHPAHAGRAFPLPPPSRYLYAPVKQVSEAEVVPLTCHVWQESSYQDNSRAEFSNPSTVPLETTVQWDPGEDQRAESWPHLPQERDSSQALDTSPSGIDVRIEETKAINFPSLEKGELAQSERPVMEPKLDLFCSSLLVIQDNFAGSDLPLLTCLTQDQEFESDSLFQQSEQEFAPLRGIPDKSEDTEWLARPSEVSEALFQATSETSSDLVNSCLSISQHPLTGSTTFGSQHSLFPSEQENNGENAPSNAPDELKDLKDSDRYDALLSYMSWQTEKDTQQLEGNLADQDQVSTSTLSDVSDESVGAKVHSDFESVCSHIQYWKQEPFEQTEACLPSQDQASFPCEVIPPPPDKTSYSFLRCMLERGKGDPFTSVNHLESVCLRTPSEDDLSPKMDPLESFGGNEDLQKELSQYFKQKEIRNILASSEVHAKSPEIKFIGMGAVPDSHERVSEAHILSRGLEISKLEASEGPLQTVKSNLDETAEQLYFQEERNQKAASTFGEKNVDATENVAFEAVIASIEPSKQESPISEIQTDINKPLADDSQEREPPKPDLPPLNYNDEKSFMDKLKHPKYQSTPGVFEPAASKPLLHKEDDGGSSLSWDPDLKSPPNAPQNMLIEGLQGKAESGIVTLHDDVEYSNLYKTADVHSEKVAELQRKVDHSNLGISQPFPSPLPSFVPQEPTSESKYYSPNLRMLRVSPDTLPTAPTRSAGDTSKGGKVAITQSKLKPDITNTFGDSDIGTRSSLPLEDITQFAVVPEGLLSEEAPEASAHLGLATPNTGTSPVTPTSYAQREKPGILYQEGLPDGYQIGQELTVLAFPGQADQKSGLSTVAPISYSQRERPDLFYQQVLTGGHLPEDIPKAPAAPSLSDQKSSFPTVTSTSYLQSDKSGVFYQHALAGGRLPEDIMKTSAAPRPTDQKFDVPASPLTSHTYEGPTVFYQQELPNSHLREETVRGSALPGPAAQNTGITALSSISPSYGEKAHTFYQQALPESYLSHQPWKVSVAPGSVDQKMGAAVVSSTYSHEVNPGSFPQEELPDRHFAEETQKSVSSASRPPGQKPEMSTIYSSYHSKGMKPIFYQHPLSESHPGKEPLDVSAVFGSPEKTQSSTVTSASQPHKETAKTFYQQTLSDSHLTEEALPVSVIPSRGDQKTPLPSELPVSYSYREKNLPENVEKVSIDSGSADEKADIPTVSSSSYQHKKKTIVPYHQEWPDSHVPAGTQKVSLVSGPVDQKSGISHSYGEVPSVFYQQELPDSHSAEKSTKTLIPGPADQKTDLSTVLPTSPSHTEKPIFPYQPTLHEAFNASSVSKPSDELSGISTVTSASHSYKERPNISHQQKFPDRHLAEEAQKVSGTTGSVDQKTGTPAVSYLQKERPGIFYQQTLSGPVSEEALQASATTRPADQSIAMPTVASTSSLQREKPQIFYQQALPGGHLPGESLKVSAAPGPPDQNIGAPAVSPTSYLPGEESIIFYQPDLSGNPLSAESFKVPGISGLPEQKTSTPAGPAGSYPIGEKPIIFYQNALPSSPLTTDTFRVAAVPGPAEQKIGTPAGPSGSHPAGEKSIIFYQQALPDGHLPKEALDILTSPGPVDLKTGEPPVYSTSYSFGEKPIIFYQQGTSESQQTKKGRKVSVVSGPADQKTGLPLVTSSSYSNLEKNTIVSYHQELPDRPLTENAGKVSVVPEPTDQKTGLPTVPSTSHSYVERPTVSYQQEFPDLSEKALEVEVLGGVGPTEQKTEIPRVPSTPLYREIPAVSYQQELPDLTEEALRVLDVPGVVPSVPYTKDKAPLISYQQELPDLTEIALKTVGPGSTHQKTGAPVVSYSSGGKPSGFHQQELPSTGKDALGGFVHPVPFVQKAGKTTEPLSYYPQREASAFSPQELPASQPTEEALKVSAGSALATQTPGTPPGPSSSYFHREKFSDFYQKASPDHVLTDNSLKASTVPGLSDQNRRPAVLSGSYSHKEKHKISAADPLDDQKTELPTVTHRSYLHREKPAIPSVIGPDDQKTPLPTASHGSYPQKVKPVISVQKQLPDRDQSEDILKTSTVSEPTVVNTGVPVPLSGSYSHREKSDTSYGYSQELPDRHLTEDALKVSGSLGQADQISGLPTVSSDAYSHSERHQLVSEHVQKLIDNLNSPESCSLIANGMPLNSQIDDGVIICKPESSGFGDVGSEEIRDIDRGSKTLKEIQTLLMEAENIALKRCNFPAPLVPFRDVNDVSLIQSKKVVCFKEPSTTDVCTQRELFTEEVPHIECVQKDIGTQTNLKCQRGVENWEFISSTAIRSPLQRAEDTARMAFDETFRRYEASRSVMRSEPEGCSTGIGNKIIIPMMTIIKSDSSSDVSDGCCSWDSNLPESLESVSDVFLNFFPYTSPKTSITDSREEEGLSESEDGCGSVDSLAAHVKYLLQCESSLNQAKQILRNAEEEECRVRAQAWNLKLSLGRDYGYSISELNEDDRRKVEEIKAKLFGHGRATHVSEGLRSPRGIGCVPEAVCSHIVIESHEKGCFRTLTAEQPRPDSRHSVFRSVEPSDVTRGQRNPSSWRGRHINLSRSIDQSNTRFKVWNSFQLQSHPPFQKLAPDDIKISKGVGMPFHACMDPQPLGLVEPTCVPAKEMDFPSSSQILPPEPKKQFTTSITFSSHGHSKYISDTSVFKVGVTEGSQCTGPSLGVFKSHIPEEQISPRDLKQKTSSPSSLKRHSHSPVTILAEGSKQRQKLPVDFEHSHQKGKLLERSDFKASHSEPSVSANYSSFKGVQFSGKDTIISPDKLSPTLEVKEKNVTIIPDLPSCILLEQRELFEQSHTPHTDHQMRKYSSPFCPDIASCIFLEQRELFEQSKAPHVDHENREDHSFFPKHQDCIVADLPSPDFLDQQQCKSPDIDDHMRKQQFPLCQGQDWVVEKIQHIPQSHFSNMVNVEAKVSNLISQSAPDHCTAASTLPSNRKALSCVRITLCPKTASTLDSGTLDERFHSLDPASKTRINSEFNFDLRTISSRSLEPTSKLLTCEPIAQDQESLGFLGPKSPPDLQVVQSSLPDSKTISQDLKTKPPQNSQIVTSRQTQVNISDLEGYSKPEGTPVSADGSREQSEAPFPTSSAKVLSDAVTQITTESPGKTTFSSEIFINVDDHGQEVLGPKAQKPSKFASSSSVQQITASHGQDAQPALLPYKPSGSSKMYYVPQLKAVPSYLESKSDTTVESSHSGSNDAIAPDFPPQVLGTRDDDLSTTVNIKHTEGIYSKRAVSKGKKPPRKDDAGYSSTTVQDGRTENLPGTKSIEQKEEICVERTIPQERCPEKEGSLEIDIAESECHSAFENTTHSVFRSAKFYFHHPVHLPHEQDLCHESLGRSVFMQHSWKDFFHHHSEHSCLPPPGPSADKTKMDYTRIKSLSINLNLGDNEKMHTIKNQARDPKSKRQTNDHKKDQKVTPELTTQCTVSLNELWNKYQERQKQQKPPGVCDKNELSLVERLDRLAKLLQNPITLSLQASESTQDESRGGRGMRGRTGRRQHQQKGKLQRKWPKSLEKGQSTGDFRKSRVLSHHGGKSNQIKIEQVKLDKYILRKQPGFNYISNTSSESRPSEESELLTDSPNIFSSTTSPVDSDVLTQTDRDVTLNERSSSISTIDTARLVQAFGHERLYLSPRRIKLYNSVTNQQRRYLEKWANHSKKALNTGYPQMTSEHTRRRHIQVTNHVSSDSVSSADSFLSLDSTLYTEENAHMLNKGVQAGNLEIVTGAKKYTRDVGVTFPTPSSSEARMEEDSDVTSGSEEKAKEKKFLANYLRDRNLRNHKSSSCEGVSWFVPVENRKSESKKENLPKIYGPGISWFEPVTKTKPWREPLREQNWQVLCMNSRGSLGGPGGDGGRVPLRPFVRATLQEALQLHRPDFISRSGERIKRLKLLVQERKLQNLFQSEREALFNAVRPLPRRGPLAAQKNKPIGKKEMIQRTKRIYEQLPEVKKKREEEKRKSEYKSYRLRAQHYKTRVTNQLLGRKVPWD